MPPHLRDLGRDPIEDAAAGCHARRPIRGRGAGAEQHVERHARIADHWQRFVRRRPTDRVGVGAGVVVGAAPGLIEVLDAELHRRHRRPLPETLGVHLIHRCAGEHVGALRLLRVRLGQEHGARPEMIAADLGQRERLGIADVGVADDGEVVAVGVDRAQRIVRNEREITARRRRREEMLAGADVVAAGQAVDFLDADQARRVGRRGRGRPCPHLSRRNHRVQERQRHRRPQAAEERPAGHLLSGDEVHGFSFSFQLSAIS